MWFIFGYLHLKYINEIEHEKQNSSESDHKKDRIRAEWNIGVSEAAAQLYVTFYLKIMHKVNIFRYLG